MNSIIPTLARVRAISKVPTVSMLDAMTGTPVHVRPLLRKWKVRANSTCGESLFLSVI